MNYLLSYGAAGMGDFIATIMFFRDFEEQMPNDKLYLKFEIPYMANKYADLLLNNPYCHMYDGTQNIDKTIHFGWGEKINVAENTRTHNDCQYIYTDVIYQAFNERAGTNIKKSRPKADIYFSQDELKPVIQSDKPICVINIGYNIMHGNAKNWGWSKFQHIVNALKDKVNFVQVGVNQAGYHHFPLIGATNMLDNSPIRWTFRLLRQARFVITHNSGLLHMSAIDNDTKRTTYCIMGGRDYYKYFECYDANNVKFSFIHNNDNFNECYEKGHYCCDCGKVFIARLPLVGSPVMCKKPSYDLYGNVICQCFNVLNPNIVVKAIEDELEQEKISK